MDTKKYDRLTKSLVYPLIEKYYASGELPSTFYKREGLSESQFYTWRQTDYLDVWAALDYRDHYPDRNADGVSVFYWYGQLDRNGILRGKLELRKDDRHSY